MYQKIQNQLEKTPVVRFPKFTIVNMAENCHQPASFSKANMVCEDYIFLSSMSDIFSTDFDKLGWMYTKDGDDWEISRI